MSVRGGAPGGTETDRGRMDSAGVRLPAAVANLDAVLHQLPTAVVVLDAGSGRVALQNEKVAEIWRRSHAAMLAEPDLSCWRGWHPSGRRYRAEEWPPYRTLRSGEAVDNEEIEIVRGDESRGVIRICSTAVRDDHGRLVAAVATILDVTEQKKEERSRRFLAHASAELVSSLSYGTTLRNVARLAIPELAGGHGRALLDVRQILERMDVLQAKMIGGDVGDDADIAMLETQSAAQHPAARGLQHCHVH